MVLYVYCSRLLQSIAVYCSLILAVVPDQYCTVFQLFGKELQFFQVVELKMGLFIDTKYGNTSIF